MAGIFREGFDLYNGTGASPGLQARFSSTGTFGSLAAGLFGGQMWVGDNTASATLTAPMDSATANATLTFNAKISVGATAADARHCISLRSGTTYMVGLVFIADGSIDVYRFTSSSAGTLLGSTAAGVWTAGVTHSFALELVIHDTTGRATLYVDDASTPKVNLTNVDTRNGTPTTVDTVAFSKWTSGTSPVLIAGLDDIYVTDSATKPSNWPLRVETIYPNSDGGTLNFTPSTGSDHYAVVDEAQANGTDYLSGSTVGHVDELGLGNLSTTPVGIEEVGIIGFAHRTDATARSIALGVKSGATTSDGSNIALAASIARVARAPLATDPNTAAAWDGAGVDALQLRPKVTV